MAVAGVLLKRSVSVIPVLGVVALIAFMLLRFASGDPVAQLAGDNADPAAIAAIRARLGLDQPLAMQFLNWLWRMLHGDLGTSIVSGQPVTALIAQRVGPTVAVSITTIVFSVVVGVPIGVLAAWRRGGWLDRFAMWTSVTGFAVPTFAIGYFWIYLLSMQFGLFPVQGYVPLSDGLGLFLWHLTLPTLTLSLVYIALIARVARTSMLEVLSEDFVRTARAKGLPERIVVFKHALRNAAVPIVSIVGIGIALLIGGVVVTESVFNLPGLGRLVVDSVLARDYPVIQGVIVVFGSAYVAINLLVDLSYSFFDPRISQQ
ncbi:MULTISPECIES: ABC transporter permease [Tardiphaga]|jgi:peptide/nickel transport system permease protein|uniref:ABC transporter permease n=1 Tax=Tardiphaga TaxID=1395974 RepID=UPI0015865BD2|nr:MULTISPECIES: ABC transporter permease [Tardiphaga]NUU43344.1 ABC transporter permease [Tardiphaga robiniae]UFS73779.1 ABC transporter permease [Tardiphaga sp. 37S4]